ncbi:MAG: hypothetical protein C7B44_01410 [Sulfobacillus thermosulfidooxidans]|nr:MAG: hypothetical protein C7B44_01410 [Sulfobacillus thermosulfidooxidans]
MFGHYLRVQEVAVLLGVSPATVRWYAKQYSLPTYRIGQGQVQHRRFKYEDVQRLALQLGKALPPEPLWDANGSLSPADAAKYLGLSLKFLVDGHYLIPGQKLTAQDLQQVEAVIYHLDPDESIQSTEKGEIAMMNHAEQCCQGRHGMHHNMGPGGHGMQGGRRNHRGGMMPNPFFDPEDLLSLKSMKRHLEAQQADIADRISEIDKLIANHPDNEQQ